MRSLVIGTIIITATMSLNLYAQGSKEKSTINAYQSLAMSETDMEDVSAVSGLNNILNIHGTPAGGLMQESVETDKPSAELNEWGFSEGESTKDFANREIDKIEQDANKSAPVDTRPQNDLATIQDNSSIVGGTQNFQTSSEISYKKDNFNHQMTKLDNGSISISRDLYIDTLKIENLVGDHYDDSRSAGSIYLSDWQSRGDTTLTPR